MAIQKIPWIVGIAYQDGKTLEAKGLNNLSVLSARTIREDWYWFITEKSNTFLKRHFYPPQADTLRRSTSEHALLDPGKLQMRAQWLVFSCTIKATNCNRPCHTLSTDFRGHAAAPPPFSIAWSQERDEPSGQLRNVETSQNIWFCVVRGVMSNYWSASFIVEDKAYADHPSDRFVEGY